METFVIGLSIASILFIVALGLAIVYGTMKVINLAHGEMVMIGAYVTVLASKHLGLSIYSCLPLAFLVAALFGLAIELLVVRPLYGRLLDTLLATWGIALILQQLIRIHFGFALFGIQIDGLGSDLQNVPVPVELQQTLHVLGTNIPVYRAYVFGVAVVLGLVSWWLIYKTRFGSQLRAVSAARNITTACGVNDKRINGTGIRVWVWPCGYCRSSCLWLQDSLSRHGRSLRYRCVLSRRGRRSRAPARYGFVRRHPR